MARTKVERVACARCGRLREVDRMIVMLSPTEPSYAYRVCRPIKLSDKQSRRPDGRVPDCRSMMEAQGWRREEG